MKYTVTKNIIEVLGKLWMPQILAATTIELDYYDLRNASDDGKGKVFSIEGVGNWLDTHSGDFSQIIDWRADFGDNAFVTNWNDEESEWRFMECFGGGGDD